VSATTDGAASLRDGVQGSDHATSSKDGALPGSVTGDWFTCKTNTCSVLSNEGVQLRPGGVAISLRGPGDYHAAGQPYCEVLPAGSYLYSGSQLEVRLPAGTMKGTADLAAGLMTITWMSLPGGGNLLPFPVYLERVTPSGQGTCP